jgi:hypothetical protein
MIGFALPVLGRSQTSEWAIEGSHLAERMTSLIVIVVAAWQSRHAPQLPAHPINTRSAAVTHVRE